MGQSPLHLTARDFDAYAPEKATSNAYSRPRLEVKQRALAWARGVIARLADLGIAVDVHGSDEHPSLRNKKRVDCQWVFFWRDQAARDDLDRLLDRGRSIASVIDDPSPYTRHAFLALRLDASHVEVCFAVHPEAQVDVDNLRGRLAEDGHERAAELTRALLALPEQFAVGVSPEDRKPASAATPDALRALIERAASGQVPLWIGWSIARETAVEHAEILDEQLEDAIVALAPIYRLVAWSRDNDHVGLDRRRQEADAERAKAHAEAEAQTEKWRSAQEEARRRSAEEARARADEQRRTQSGPAHAGPPKPRKPSLDTLFATPPRKPKSEAPSARPEAKAPPAAVTMEASRSAPIPPAPRADVATFQEPSEARSKSAPDAHHASAHDAHPAPPAPPAPPALEKGSRVRVRSGPFADKVGVIGELDGRGGARVLLGLLSTRLDLDELEPVIEGRAERPAIQSSHRKPIPAAPRKARG